MVRILATLALMTAGVAAYADSFGDATSLFRRSSQSASFFKSSYGYAIFPTVGEGGFVVAGAHGTGRAYVRGQHVGDTTLTQVSIGAQIGGKAFSEIVFFENKAAFDQFTSGNFEFSADASATAITAGADASAGTTGANAGASVNKNKAGTMSTSYFNGVSVFTIVKGGAMLQAAVGGQKFGYTAR